MIYPATEWFEITQYNDKKTITIANLAETTWLVRYTWPVWITYERGVEFLGHKFKIILIEQKYGIKTKPASRRNPQPNTSIQVIHQVFGNLVHTYNIKEEYIYDSDAAAAFAVQST